jgi:hypothetical protein
VTFAPLHPSEWATTPNRPTASINKSNISKSEFSNLFAHTGQGHLRNLLLMALLYKRISWVRGCIVYAIRFGYEIRGSVNCGGLDGYGLDGQGWVFVRNEVWTFATASTPILWTTQQVVVGRDSSVRIATRYGLDGPGIESRWRGETGPGAHPASYTMGTGSFPWVKRPGRGVDHPPPSSAEVEVRVQLYICLPIPLQFSLYAVSTR